MSAPNNKNKMSYKDALLVATGEHKHDAANFPPAAPVPAVCVSNPVASTAAVIDATLVEDKAAPAVAPNAKATETIEQSIPR